MTRVLLTSSHIYKPLLLTRRGKVGFKTMLPKAYDSRRRSLSGILTKASFGEGKDIEKQLLPGQNSIEDDSSRFTGPLSLLAVAFLWGTYSPTLKLLYKTSGPPDPAALTAIRGVIQAACLWLTSLLLRSNSAGGKDHETDAANSLFPPSNSLIWIAGLEMGFWNFLATSLQAIGLEKTTAVRSAFIVQATAVLTPLLAVWSGERPSRNMWAGCGIALLSSALITLDFQHPTTAPSSSPLISLGDAAVFGAAFFYSVTTVRLGHYAQRLPAISVASAKSNALAAWAAAWLVVLAARKTAEGEPVVALWEGFAQPQAWLLILWAAIGPGALAAYFQTKGQSRTQSSQAQVYYSSTPIWSALLALILLDGEGMGPLGWLGGGGILIAGLLAAQ